MMQPIINRVTYFQEQNFLKISQIFADPRKYLSSKFFAESSWHLRIHVCVYLVVALPQS